MGLSRATTICLPGNPPETIANFLREKLMGVPAVAEDISFAGITVGVFDITQELHYTHAFLAERKMLEVGKYDAYVNVFDLTTMVSMDCNFYSLFYPHFLLLVEIVAQELSKHFGVYALVSIDTVNEPYCLFDKGVRVIIPPANPDSC
ncbi:hypothetical protein [Hymenobacter sp. YC55]|uniref:hypothetical protein n=1 Tax=Hymenobacter sp. YC55 TaxID=3034019 RepID=UPI0023F9451B|nr:hypothetical protein [Hymenobacter sp. YC55]MDF7815223.1 hypothetical protein [Hymenobacter sp. YC55]